MHYFEEDEIDITQNKCKFVSKDDVVCDRAVMGSSDYCLAHRLCRCAVCCGQASHECDSSYQCKSYLCNNRYCQADHNITYHINLKYTGDCK